MDKKVRTNELFDSFPHYLKALFEGAEHPWEVLPRIKEYALSLVENGIEGFALFVCHDMRIFHCCGDIGVS